MHSTRTVGILSWVESVSILFGFGLMVWYVFRTKIKDWIKPREVQLLLFILLQIFIGIIPSALTHEGIPHALRPIGAWPFVALASGI